VPRIRSVKPETFTSETLARCTVRARWTFAGLWCYVDDEGRGKSNNGLVKAAVWPLDDDVTLKDVGQFLDELEGEHLICRYEVDGRGYLHVVNFGEHQHPNRPVDSKLPACSRRTHGGLSEHSGKAHSEAPGAHSDANSGAAQVTSPPRASAEGKSAGQMALTEDTVSTHGVRKAKSSTIPPTPKVVDTGDGVGEGSGNQQASPAAGNGSGSHLTPTQRSKAITDAYHAVQPMCKWPAVNGVVMHAIKAGKYSDDQIRAALLRMAPTSQSVTVDSLRIEIEGFTPRSGARAPYANPADDADYERRYGQ
jgi:hypothetical protein